MIMEALRDGYTVKREGDEIVIFRTMSETLLSEASEATGISIPRLRGGERSTPVARARFAIIWTMREHSGLSLPQIGNAIGGRDHTTVMHACRRAKALRETDPEFLALCDRLAGVAAE
jgi:chromosomal replication initiator protein